MLHISDGSAATRLDASVYPVKRDGRVSDVSARYEHAEGIRIFRADAERVGIEIEE